MSIPAQRWGVAVLLICLAVIFWKLRIIDTGTNPTPSFHAGDMYAQHFPMTWYGFHALRNGELPLWNPHGLCGEPFIAIPYVGLFYPLGIVYLLFGVPAGTELETILHMAIGLVGMWALMRHQGASHLAAVTAALTFGWSGWLLYNVNQPALFAGLNWMPATVLLLQSVAAGARFAWLGLILAVALQLLRGAGEILSHALLVGAVFVAAGLLQVSRDEGVTVAFRRFALIAICGVAGASLAALQLLPTLELAGMSTRAAGTIPFETAAKGNVPFANLVAAALGSDPRTPLVTVGLLPLLCLPLVTRTPTRRAGWVCAVVGLTLAVTLIPGGVFFYYYHSLPMLGSLFRTPQKFLDIYTLSLAMIAGFGVMVLERWRTRQRRALWRDPGWLATLVLAVGLLASTILAGLSAISLTAILVLLAVFGSSASLHVRTAMVVALALVHATNQFLSVSNRDMRPWHRPEVNEMFPPAMRYLARLPPQERFYFFSDPRPGPGWHTKLGMMNGFNVAADYESLVPARYGTFFDRVVPPDRLGTHFAGIYALTPRSNWSLMDLTGTRYYVAQRGRLSDLVLTSARDLDLKLLRDGYVRVYERERAMPRVYTVGRARVVADPDELLRELGSPAFDPWREVLLEEEPAGGLGDEASVGPARAVAVESYKPERVSIVVEDGPPRFLVLTDLLYPGWKAFEGNRELPIYQANYLFRAVRVPSGRKRVTFVYRPTSFTRGLQVTAATVCAVVVAALIAFWRRGLG